MRVFLEFGEQRVDVGQCSIPQLASIDPGMITQQLFAGGISQPLSGLAVFENAGRPSWEAYPSGGDLSWRGDLTRVALRRVWRALCCMLAEKGRPLVGARLLNKCRGGSNMIKIEVWYVGPASAARALVLKVFDSFLPAASTQFVGVSHQAKIQRTGVAQHSAKTRVPEATRVLRGHTVPPAHRSPRDQRKRGRRANASEDSQRV